MRYEICKGDYNTMGAEIRGTLTTFTVENKRREECMLLLHAKEGGEPERIPMTEDENQTAVYSVGIKNLPWKEYDYTFEIGGRKVMDPYAKCISGREKWADFSREEKEIKCGFYKNDFHWGTDRLPRVPKQDMVMYKLHVRGFSMLQKLPKEELGTFQGIARKLPYLAEMGITTLELMPVYEFEEVFSKDPYQWEPFSEEKVNYWGYTAGNYFAVKSAYLGENRTPDTLKQLIRRMHRRGMECILEFYFDKKLNPHFVIEILRYWAREYHVDGFHVLCSDELAQLIAKDGCLRGRKLFFEGFSEELCRLENHEMELFSYNDGFLYGVRRLMNHQGGSPREFADQMRRQQKNQGFVNYAAINNGFTLYDAFSYTEKKNQANGEENRDGVAWNFSSNCGEEGPSRRKYVNRLREKQVKNALCTVMFSQGVPLLYMGDECGNTQNGNNNAYCQDNEIGWKSWELTKKSRGIHCFFKQLAKLRQEYPALRNPVPMELCDYRGYGYPDLSYHGEKGWRMGAGSGDSSIGMMYCCRYAMEEGERKAEDKREENRKLKDDYIYLGFNFSAFDQQLALPALPKEYRWYCILNTGEEKSFEEHQTETGAPAFLIHKQTVCMLVGRAEEVKKPVSRKEKGGKGKPDKGAAEAGKEGAKRLEELSPKENSRKNEK